MVDLKSGSFRNILVKLALAFFLVLLILLLTSFFRSGIYSKELGLNIAVVGEDSIAIALIRPGEGHILWIKLPLAMRVKIIDSAAEFPIYSLWKFADKERDSLDLVSRSIASTMGVIVSSTIKIKGELTPENMLSNLHTWKLNTNLSIRDRILLRKDLVGLVSTRKTIETDLPTNALTKLTDPDGVEFLEVNNVINLWTKSNFVFEKLLGEDIDVEVYNLSKVPGKALLMSRQLESAGVRVTEVGSSYGGVLPGGDGCWFSSVNSDLQTVFLLKNLIGCREYRLSEGLEKKGIVVWIN